MVDLEDGTYFSDIDEQSARDVAVIGAGIAEELFPFEDPIGKSIRLRRGFPRSRLRRRWRLLGPCWRGSGVHDVLGF